MDNPVEATYCQEKSDHSESTLPPSYHTHATTSVDDYAAPSCNAPTIYYHGDSRHAHAAQGTPHGYPYYPQPTIDGYTGPGYVDSQGCQQSQPVTYVVPQTPIVVAAVPVAAVSMTAAIVLSCFVYLFCGVLFGGIAFALAMVGLSSANVGDIRGALRMRQASIALSFVGIAVGIIAIVVIAIYFRSPTAASSTSRYYIYYYG